MSEVTLFWGGFGCYNKKLSSRIKSGALWVKLHYFGEDLASI